MSIQASYTKLRDGSWGARVEGRVAPGAQITVRKRSGEAKQETVGRVVWSEQGVSLVTLQASAAPQGGSGRRGSYRRRNEDDECELCGKNKYTCGHCIGW